LTDHNIDFIYKPEKIKYKDKFYYPDFKIKNELIEIKGEQFFNKSGQLQNPITKELDIDKQECLKSNHIKILRKNDLLKVFEYVNSKYGKNHVNSFRRKYKK
jgi:hypothetical protein